MMLSAAVLAYLTDGRGLTITVTTVRALYGESFGKRESISIGTPRNLWQKFPEATMESTRFGTLVFFQGLDHRHPARHDSLPRLDLRGVMLSISINPINWRSRIIGYRRIFAPVRRERLQ